MNETIFPATPEEYEEYCAVMDDASQSIHLDSKDFVPASEIVPQGFSIVRSVR